MSFNFKPTVKTEKDKQIKEAFLKMPIVKTKTVTPLVLTSKMSDKEKEKAGRTAMEKARINAPKQPTSNIPPLFSALFTPRNPYTEGPVVKAPKAAEAVAKKFLSSATLGLTNAIPTRYARNIEAKAERQPVLSALGSAAGYIAPTALTGKLLKSATSKTTTELGKALLKTGVGTKIIEKGAFPIIEKVAEGAIIGGGVETAQNVIPLLKGEKNIKQVGKDVGMGITFGAALDGGFGLSKQLLKKMATVDNLSTADMQAIAKQLQIPVDNVDNVVNNYRKTIQEELGLPKNTTAQQYKTDVESQAYYDSFKKTPEKIVDEFQTWRSKNFGGATGKMPPKDIKALKELYLEDTGIDFDGEIAQAKQDFANKTGQGAPFFKNQKQIEVVNPLLNDTVTPQQQIKPLLDITPTETQKGVIGDSVAFNVPREETSIPLPKTTALTLPKQQESKVAKVLTELPTKTKIPMVEKGAKIYQSLVSTDLPLERLGRANEKVSNLASTNRKVTGSVDYVLANKMTDNEGNEVGKSLFDVFKDVPQENKSDLFEYALQKHNIRRFEEGKPVFGDAIDSNVSQQRLAELRAKNPELEAQSKEVTGYMNNLMESWALKSGLVNEDSLRILREKYPDYVPTYRLKDTDKAIITGGSKGNVSSTIKKAKGSADDILPLDQQMAMLTNKVIRASRKNELYNSIYDAFDNNPEFVERFFKPISTEKADLTDGIESIVKDYDEPIKKVGDTYELNFYRNGEKVKAQISADLFEAIKPLQEATGVEALGEIVRKYATNPFKSLITQYNPIFVARNIMRDIPTAFIYSNDAIEWSKQMPIAFKEIASNGKAWKEYQALGGTRSGIFSYDKGVNTPFKGKSDNLLVKGARGTLNAVETANNLTETLPRFAEYLATVKKGNNSYDSKLQGIMRASEITTDFTRSGKVTKGADAFIPYLNPSVQGIDRFARLVAKKPLQTALKGGLIITVPTVILDQINKDNKAYKEINEREKNQYYLIPDGSGKFTRIPKSRETGVIFSTVFDWIARRSRGEEVTPKEIISTIKENFSPVNPFENSIITPLLKGIEQIKDPERDVKNYAGISLIPSALKKYAPKEQYDQYTSYVAKELGSLAGVSPKVIDYLIRSYTGILGQTLMPKTSASQRGVVEAAFKTDPVFKSGLPNKFYDTLEKQTQELNKQKREEKEKGTKIERDLERSVKALNKVSKDIAEFRKMQKEIDGLNISQEEKDRRIRELQMSMNDLARKVIEGEK